MKNLIYFSLLTLLTTHLFAQSPEKMSYQAVVRDANNALITNTQIGMKISILKGSANGNPIYEQTQNPTTNSNGLVSIEIGTNSGPVSLGLIDWADGVYFIKTEIDPQGGSSYTVTGTTQLLSVPYALYADQSPLAQRKVYHDIFTTSYVVDDRYNWGLLYDNHSIKIASDLSPGFVLDYIYYSTLPGTIMSNDGSDILYVKGDNTPVNTVNISQGDHIRIQAYSSDRVFVTVF